jgi:hypothetical protein
LLDKYRLDILKTLPNRYEKMRLIKSQGLSAGGNLAKKYKLFSNKLRIED